MTAHTTSARVVADVLALEAVAARSWPAIETAWDGGWLLRASAGWTRRANSAVPLREVAAPQALIERTQRWYAARGLTPAIAVPQPERSPLAQELAERGWSRGLDVEVMVADLDRVLAGLPARPDLAHVHVMDAPSSEWLGAYRSGTLPEHAVHILCGADARFVGLRDAGQLVGIVRHVVEPPWVGISAMEVVPTQRRRGLALHLLRGALEHASAADAERAWLQVESSNAAACGLYRRAGFTTNHTYRYYELDDDGDET